MGIEVILDEWDAARPPAEDEAMLPDGEISRIARQRQPADRGRALQARALLRRELGRRLGLPPREVPIVVQPGGKPMLGPGMPALEFSLSHSAGLVAVAFSSCPVGIDVEWCRPMDVAGFAARVFAPAEAARILGHDVPLHRLFDHWVAKEAVVKATGQGLAAGLRGLILHDPGPGLTPLAAGPADIRVALVPVRSGYHGAVALKVRASD